MKACLCVLAPALLLPPAAVRADAPNTISPPAVLTIPVTEGAADLAPRPIVAVALPAEAVVSAQAPVSGGSLGLEPSYSPFIVSASPSAPADCVSYTGGPCVTQCEDGQWSSSSGGGTRSGHGGEAP